MTRALAATITVVAVMHIVFMSGRYILPCLSAPARFISNQSLSFASAFLPVILEGHSWRSISTASCRFSTGEDTGGFGGANRVSDEFDSELPAGVKCCSVVSLAVCTGA